jgi:uncharacterized protein DUF3551
MRHIIALSSLLAVLALAAPQAGAQSSQQRTFCLKEDSGGTNCGFATMEQCQQAQTGNADFCIETSR